MHAERPEGSCIHFGAGAAGPARFVLFGEPFHGANGPCGLGPSRCCLRLGPQLGLPVERVRRRPSLSCPESTISNSGGVCTRFLRNDADMTRELRTACPVDPPGASLRAACTLLSRVKALLRTSKARRWRSTDPENPGNIGKNRSVPMA